MLVEVLKRLEVKTFEFKRDLVVPGGHWMQSRLRSRGFAVPG
jgi:hypothetical protein